MRRLRIRKTWKDDKWTYYLEESSLFGLCWHSIYSQRSNDMWFAKAYDNTEDAFKDLERHLKDLEHAKDQIVWEQE